MTSDQRREAPGQQTDDQQTDDQQTDDQAGPRDERQTDELVAIAETNCVLFHDRRLRAYARWSNGQVCRLDGSAFRHRLHREYRRERGRGANPGVLRAAIEELTSAAVCDGDQRDVFVRVGEDEGDIHVDLGDESWEAIQISPGEVKVGPAAVNFDRKPQAQPLPNPTPEGDLDLLAQFVNSEDEDSFRLIQAWTLGTLLPTGPFPVLVLEGEQGSGKSATAEVLKRLTDPVAPLVRSLPTNERDLAIAATGNRVLAFDNVSYIKPSLSDALCRLASGGGFATRALYENEEEAVFEQARPLILNGLGAVVRRQDLLDRAIVLRLPRIPPERRRPESELWPDLERAKPKLLRGLADTAACALERLPGLAVPELPRLADFARWVTAAEPALGWEDGTFLRLFGIAQAAALRESLESDPLADAVLVFLNFQDDREWSGTPTELHSELSHRVSEEKRRLKSWPVNAQSMSAKLTPILQQASGSRARR